MDYEQLKEEFIKLKGEELDYVDKVARLSIERELTDNEKFTIYRKLKDFGVRINNVIESLHKEATNLRRDHKEYKNPDGLILDIEVDKNYLSFINGDRDYILKSLWINPETNKIELSYNRGCYTSVTPFLILNGQNILNRSIYIFAGVYREYDDLGLSYSDYGVYYYINDRYTEEILVDEMDNYEKDKTIIEAPSYVCYYEVQRIFKEELDNPINKSFDDCIKKTEERIANLSLTRSPEYKENVILNKINELYQAVKGELNRQEIIYEGNFLNILKETYTLPNGKIVAKEKIIKNGGKNAVIIIAITLNGEFLITFQNRINNVLISEFPSGYIEVNEDPIEAAKRELLEETGYTSSNIFILDKAYTSPGIDNSTTYIVVANNCVKEKEVENTGTELVNYGMITKEELDYLIVNDIMNGSMNKLAYYSFLNNVDDSGCMVTKDYTVRHILEKKIKKNPFTSN